MNLKVRCPLCKMILEANIDKEYLQKSPSGITPIAFTHGEPKHVLVVYLDRQGFQRGYEVFESVVDAEINIDDIIEIIGKKNLARLLAAILQDAEIYVRIDKVTAEIIQKLLTLIGNKRFIKIVNSPKEAEYKFDFITGKFDKVIGEKYFLKVLNKLEKLTSNEAKIAFLEASFHKLDQILREAESILKSRKKLFYKWLKTNLDVDKDSWSIVEKVLIKRGYKGKLSLSALEVIIGGP